ncbi:MAG: CCA tRNA nucleotidyltransferase [Gemmataceae bacterium]|nr:CCA tRNA nucleotidyltransferase [Gemmataceae bacterium]
MTEREFAVSVVRQLQDAGFEALWAGGCVRDELLGLAPKDYDVASSARPEQVQALFRRTIAIGESFGVVEVLGPKVAGQHLKVQVATFRNDGAYSDGRRPEQVVFSSAQEDAQRRDFTINGMFFDPIGGHLHDFVGGRDDLHARILRAIGEPNLRFQEDKLRLLRAVRIATRFELAIESATESAIRAMADQLPVVSAERIAEELRQLLVHPRRVRGLNLLMDLGLAQAVLPELVLMKGLPQGPPSQPTGDLWDHAMRVMDGLGDHPSFPLAFGTLLHDVGKPGTFARTGDRLTFYHHEHLGARMADEICLRLKLSNSERVCIVWLVEKHQYLADAERMKPSKLKPMLIHSGIHELLVLHRADALATGKDVEHVEFCERLLRESDPSELNPAVLITGNDLLAMGITQGPRYKQILDAVREAQLDGTMTTPAEALALARRMAGV